MQKGQYEFREVTKYCLFCGAKLVLNNMRDVKRKKYCSHSCQFSYLAKTLGLQPPKPTKESWAKAGRTLSLRMAKGLIPKPPRKPSRVKKYCSECGRLITYAVIHGLCQTCFNRAKTNKVQCFCDNCGEEIEKIPSSFEGLEHHFCSSACFYAWKRSQPSEAKVHITCSICGKEFERYQSCVTGSHVFCSQQCHGEFMAKNRRGERAPRYIDGRTPLRLLLKNSAKYAVWKKEVLLRDGFKCVDCGIKSGFLHAHHLLPFSVILGAFLKQYKDIGDKTKLVSMAFQYEKFWDVDNGVTLCIDCHQKRHPDINLTMGVKENAVNYAN